MNDLLVRCGDHTLAVDLYDAVTDADPSSLSDSSPHQAADLHTERGDEGNRWSTETGGLLKQVASGTERR